MFSYSLPDYFVLENERENSRYSKDGVVVLIDKKIILNCRVFLS